MMEGVRQALRNRSASSPTDPSVPGRQPIASYFPSWAAPGSSEFFDRQAEYNQLVAAAGLPEGSITVERGDPDLGRLGELEELANRLETVVANQRETLGVFTRPTEPAEPVTLPSSRTPIGGDPSVALEDPVSLSIEVDEQGRMLRRPNESIVDFIRRVYQFRGTNLEEVLNEVEASLSPSGQMRRLENLQQALVALGFPSGSISLGASGDQSIILAFHRSPSVELETTSRRDNVTLTFTHRR
jgi:hypothetical protein